MQAYSIDPGIIVIFKIFLRRWFVGNRKYGQIDVTKILFFCPTPRALGF